MIPTIPIKGSDDVLAPAGIGSTFIRTRRQTIMVTNLSEDSKTPANVKTALIGMKISTIFTKEHFPALIEVPAHSRFAYASEVIEALEADGETEAAEDLRIVASNKLDMYVFTPGTFVLMNE